MSDREREQELQDRFRAAYGVVHTPVMLEIERTVLGSDHGASSWTTSREADRFAELLDLGPGSKLLDVGSGAGWPGLYLAKKTGCSVTLTDVPVEGLQAARSRIARDGLIASGVVARGESLPFREGTFHAVSHSDVLC